MKSRGPERVLKKDVHGAADQWIKMVRNAHSENPQGALTRALLQWLRSPDESSELHMLALGTAMLLWLKVSAGSKAFTDEELALLEMYICSMYHLQSRQSELGPEEQQELKAASIKMRPILSELRRFLRLWFAEQPTCGAHTAPPLTTPV